MEGDGQMEILKTTVVTTSPVAKKCEPANGMQRMQRTEQEKHTCRLQKLIDGNISICIHYYISTVSSILVRFKLEKDL